jgi:hypothetical protein
VILPEQTPNPIKNTPPRSPVKPVATSLMPYLSDPEYYTIPTIEEMRIMPEATLRALSDFVIGNNSGRIKFTSSVNVLGADLNDIFKFDTNGVDAYEGRTQKPRVGEGLNKSCIIELTNIYPKPNHSVEDF